MAIQFEVRAEIADKLTALAKARGISVEELLVALLSKPEESQPEIVEPSLEEFERDMDTLAEGLEQLPAEYGGTYSRADIYADQTDVSRRYEHPPEIPASERSNLFCDSQSTSN